MRKNQKEMLEHLSTVKEMKSILHRHTSVDLMNPRKQSMNLNIGQQKSQQLKQEESKRMKQKQIIKISEEERVQGRRNYLLRIF